MKKNKLFYILVLLITFSSCSNSLNKKEAASLISKIPNEIIKGEIQIYLQSGNWNKEALLSNFYNLNSKFINRRILTNPQIKEDYHQTGSYYTVISNFTDSANTLILERDWHGNFIVKCGELKFSSIVGIFQDNNSKTAEIEYKVEFTNPTLFTDLAKMESKYEKGTSITRKKIAKKYDNGWKIE